MPNPLLTNVHYEYGTPYATTCYGWSNDCENDAQYTLEYNHITHGYTRTLLCEECMKAFRIVFEGE